MTRTTIMTLMTMATFAMPIVACTKDRTDDRPSQTQTTSGTPAPRDETTRVENAPPDNTKQNERDRNGANATPMDQSNDPMDLQLTQSIRKAVIADDGLSTTAKNAKIIASGGRVVLRGPVQTEAEKASIAAKAQQIAGAGKVDNQLEVKNR